MQTYARPEIVFTHGEGCKMYDAFGKEYLDFAAGIAVNALGGLFGSCVRCFHRVLLSLLCRNCFNTKLDGLASAISTKFGFTTSLRSNSLIKSIVIVKTRIISGVSGHVFKMCIAPAMDLQCSCCPAVKPLI